MTNKVDTSLWDIEAKQHSKRVYFNKPQLLTQYIGAKTTVIVAGRRTGKTDSIASPFVLRNMQRMPGSTGGIVVPTFKHGLTNTLPGLLAAWKRWGYINGVHYVVGRKPPKSFAKPITEPADYEHVITFYNGSVAIIISQDRPGSSNSLTLSWLLIDEAKFSGMTSAYSVNAFQMRSGVGNSTGSKIPACVMPQYPPHMPAISTAVIQYFLTNATTWLMPLP
mgnify:CR=1 FL=1